MVDGAVAAGTPADYALVLRRLTGRPYDNRFVSVVTVRDRKVAHWRDYLDPTAVFDAQGWPHSGRA
ncbi:MULTISPECIES: nuclear transport factor 2 family protein [Streptomycetaceae]|uniref:nuclear transport factor 2 family protein n=1 Tax=Streptomycetaceae TaxID=2062 RepID=UPI00093F29BE|nr:hypothetical protein [Streptomyces sp. CB02056]OKI06512.1 hypothetical protein AMK13_18290 [Streptomyces sp. CB02056]